jgi:hypothetical protein
MDWSCVVLVRILTSALRVVGRHDSRMNKDLERREIGRTQYDMEHVGRTALWVQAGEGSPAVNLGDKSPRLVSLINYNERRSIIPSSIGEDFQ